MNDLSKILIVLLVIVALWSCIAGIIIGPEPQVYDSNEFIEQALVQRVPTVTQMQRAVGAEPDGFWGKDSQAKWEERICQQYADDMWPKGE